MSTGLFGSPPRLSIPDRLNRLERAMVVQAVQTSVQSIPTGAMTKLVWDDVDFDPEDFFDLSNNRFLPRLAGAAAAPGYWEIGGNVALSAMGDQKTIQLAIYKNGALWKEIARATTSCALSATVGANGACLVYLDGVSDYVEWYVQQSQGAARNTLATNGDYTYAWARRAR